MGKIYDAIDDRLREFIERQQVFFVATAPLDAEGHVNLSPRGVPGTHCVVEDHLFAWLDLSGSGAETVAHLRENGRITVMFCAFEGPPKILRLHGTGRTISVYDEEYADWAGRFPDILGARAVIVVDVERISDSCGYGVPLMEYVGERDLIPKYFEGKSITPDEYRRKKNGTSIDGLPAFDG